MAARLRARSPGSGRLLAAPRRPGPRPRHRLRRALPRHLRAGAALLVLLRPAAAGHQPDGARRRASWCSASTSAPTAPRWCAARSRRCRAGQREAARALGLTDAQIAGRIVHAPGGAAMVPPAGNLLIELLKTTALASTHHPHRAHLPGRSSLRRATLRTVEIFALMLVLYFVLARVIDLRHEPPRAPPGAAGATPRRRRWPAERGVNTRSSTGATPGRCCRRCSTRLGVTAAGDRSRLRLRAAPGAPLDGAPASRQPLDRRPVALLAWTSCARRRC